MILRTELLYTVLICIAFACLITLGAILITPNNNQRVFDQCLIWCRNYGEVVTAEQYVECAWQCDAAAKEPGWTHERKN